MGLEWLQKSAVVMEEKLLGQLARCGCFLVREKSWGSDSVKYFVFWKIAKQNKKRKKKTCSSKLARPERQDTFC